MRRATASLVVAAALTGAPARAQQVEVDAAGEADPVVPEPVVPEPVASEPVEVEPIAPVEVEVAAPIEVTVEGDRVPPGSVSLGRRAIREMPGVLGDPYRAIEVEPGVTPAASGVPYYFIRGAPPGNVGYFFDGIEVPLLFHAGAGPGVIPHSVVQRVDLHLGPYPAEIGRFAGAVVDARSTPPADRWRGEGSIRFLDLGGMVEGPVTDSVTVLAGGHYAAGAAILSALVPSVDVSYADYQLRASWKLAATERITALVFGSYDYLASVTGEGDAAVEDVLLDSDFHRLDVRYQRQTAGGGEQVVAMTLGLDQSRGVGADLARNYKLGVRSSVSRPLASGKALVRVGVDLALDGYTVEERREACEPDCAPGSLAYAQAQLEEAFPELFPERIDLAVGAWVETALVLDDRSSITPALRIDHYSSLGETALAVDPKLVGRFGVGRHLSLVPAVGIASQLPGFAPLPALQIAGIPGGLQRSVQTSFGAEVGAGPLELTATGFRHATLNLNDALGTGRGTTFGAERFLTRSLGEAYGLELSARGALRRDLFFFASYTLSRATRSRDGGTFPSAYDRTHVAHVALLHDLGRGWRAGFRHVFYTGFPAEEEAPGRPLSEHPERTKPFYRIDARLSKRWSLGPTSYLGVTLDVQNATLSREVFDVSCDDTGCEPRTIGPIAIPTLALEGGF